MLAFACKDRWWEEPLPRLSEKEIEERLASEGVITLPHALSRTIERQPLIEVAGEPCSEMILRERK